MVLIRVHLIPEKIRINETIGSLWSHLKCILIIIGFYLPTRTTHNMYKFFEVNVGCMKWYLFDKNTLLKMDLRQNSSFFN